MKLNSNGYTAHYRLTRLVYYECHPYADDAIRREKQIKNWSRKKKIALIESMNPKWDDLSRDWGTAIDFEAALGPLFKKKKT